MAETAIQSAPGHRKKRRARFEILVKKLTRKGEAAWDRANSKLESEWKDFEADVGAYVRKAQRQSGFQKSTFRKLTAARSNA